MNRKYYRKDDIFYITTTPIYNMFSARHLGFERWRLADMPYTVRKEAPWLPLGYHRLVDTPQGLFVSQAQFVHEDA